MNGITCVRMRQSKLPSWPGSPCVEITDDRRPSGSCSSACSTDDRVTGSHRTSRYSEHRPPRELRRAHWPDVRRESARCRSGRPASLATSRSAGRSAPAAAGRASSPVGCVGGTAPRPAFTARRSRSVSAVACVHLELGAPNRATVTEVEFARRGTGKAQSGRARFGGTGAPSDATDVLIVEEYIPEYRRRFFEMLEAALAVRVYSAHGGGGDGSRCSRRKG